LASNSIELASDAGSDDSGDCGGWSTAIVGSASADETPPPPALLLLLLLLATCAGACSSSNMPAARISGKLDSSSSQLAAASLSLSLRRIAMRHAAREKPSSIKRSASSSAAVMVAIWSIDVLRCSCCALTAASPVAIGVTGAESGRRTTVATQSRESTSSLSASDISMR
jgi:hypothetical protein